MIVLEDVKVVVGLTVLKAVRCAHPLVILDVVLFVRQVVVPNAQYIVMVRVQALVLALHGGRQGRVVRLSAVPGTVSQGGLPCGVSHQPVFATSQGGGV